MPEDVKSDIILSCAKNKTVVYVVPQFYEISLYRSRTINLNDLMVMLVDISGDKCDFGALKQSLHDEGEKQGMQINVMHEDIFNSMHRI